MRFIFRLLDFIVLRSEWVYTQNSPYIDNNWSILQTELDPLPSSEGRIWFKPYKKSLKRGWYLFVIKHTGNNPKATGWLRSGKFGFSQARPMYPERRRYRVIHVNRTRSILLELQNVHNSIIITDLRLIRLPFFNAFKRIKRRCQKFSSLIPEQRNALWKYYNQLLNSQAGKYQLISYARWIKQIEASQFSKFFSRKRSLSEKIEFAVIADNSFSVTRHADWVILLRPGTILSNNALKVLDLLLSTTHQSNLPLVFYGDEDQITDADYRHSHMFKPSWNFELFLSDPFYSNHWVVRADFWNSFLQGKIISNWWSAQYLLLCTLQSSGKGNLIRHLPCVLAHTCSSQFNQNQVFSALKAGIEIVFPLKKPVISFLANRSFAYQWAMPKDTLVSVLIPTKDGLDLLEACLHSLESHYAGCAYEIIIINNGSVEQDTLSFLELCKKKPNYKVLDDNGVFNFSRLNNKAVDVAEGSVLLFMNNDIEIFSDNWAACLASNALRHGVGCVGAQLHYSDQTIQHGGVVLGIGGLASHAHKDFPSTSSGYMGRLQLPQYFSAVTAACLAVSKSTWDDLGGFDAKNLAVNYNDVDLCLRAQSAGFNNLYLPQVKAIHHESKTRGKPKGKSYLQWRKEWAVMENRWKRIISNDPYYHPALTLEDESWSLSFRVPPLALR